VAELAALQRRFFDRVTAGPANREPEDGPGDGANEAPGEPWIASGDLEIYARMYRSRLLDALSGDYPKLHAALGNDRFREVAEHYLRARPPRSFTLRDAGVALAAHLRTAALAPPWAADLAALERARIEVFDGPDSRPLTHGELVALGAALPELTVSWVASCAFVPIGWSIDDLWSAIEDDQAMPVPEPVARAVLVWRRGVQVLHRTLDPDETELARDLATGARFAAICERLGELHGDRASERAVELLLRWLEAEAVTGPGAAAPST
jgi:hypothetical protein